MKDLQNQCARELMEITPQIMQAIRVEMRGKRGADISISQFRSLRFIQKTPDSSLSRLAEHLGLMLPSVSKLVDGLFKAGLVTRQESTTDRRCMTLRLTSSGEAIVDAARANAQAYLAKKMVCYDKSELETIQQSMLLMHRLFEFQCEELPGQD